MVAHTDSKRPKNWDPLSDSDPTPGDPKAIREELKHFKHVAKTLRSQAQALKKISAEKDLKGRYARDLQDKAGTLEKHLREVAERYERVHAPLEGWANELEEIQDESLKLLKKARHEENDAPDKEGKRGASGPTKDDDSTANKLASVITHYQERAQHYSGKITSVVHDIIQDSTWESLKEDVGDALHNKWVKKFFELASWIATGVALIGIFCTPWGWLTALALGLTALIMTKDAIALATGNGSIYDVSLDVLVLATMGMGRVAGQGMRFARDSAKGAAIRSASQQASQKVVRSSRTPLGRVRSLLGGGTKNRATRAGSKAAQKEASRPLAQATKKEIRKAGGDLKIASKAKDTSLLRARYPHNLDIQKADNLAQFYKTMHNVGWRTSTAIGIAPKLIGGSNLWESKPHSDSYSKWQERHKLTYNDGY